ncbi:hypothetical protein MWU38_03755 [Qipengyuania sp. S6317L1]|uniref:hypothetical protein n=1 Tax=Qipengyuania sp. S6317L1 TaxID=2926410 RepID=UPI001FF293E6|nr:hypothetical protein [Qipengyuania sp. S6317L1]MCK0098491.1 hypothetical protein [Qipengyuania sp. S6317L1]
MSPDAAAVIIPNLPWIIGGALAVGGAGVMGWIYTTRLRIKHGYPLEGAWGQAIKPVSDHEAKQRVTLLTQENAELRAELGAVKDRLSNVERIVTDGSYQLSSEIDQLRSLENQKDAGSA